MTLLGPERAAATLELLSDNGEVVRRSSPAARSTSKTPKRIDLG
jgi:hypothetical protein